MQIDAYGHEATSVFFLRKKESPYRILKENNITYLCFDDRPTQPIHRITETGSLTVIEWAFGSWENRKSLNYIPINQTMEIDNAYSI